jgi:hypothetical protein
VLGTEDTAMAQPNATGPRVPPQNDLYTFNLIVAAALLLVGIIYVSWRTISLFGSLFPPAGG